MKQNDLKEKLLSGTFDSVLSEYYPGKEIETRDRILKMLTDSQEFLQNREVEVFSAPGRSEVGGNHTDHQLGRVLAAAIDLDILGIVAVREDSKVSVKADGFEIDSVDIQDDVAHEKNYNTSDALIQGIAVWFRNHGYQTGGFDLYEDSQVLQGSGMSSSAAFEVLIGTVFSEVYNGGKVTPIEIAMAGQYAENVFFHKACGLMDQTASAAGGFITIDFKDKEKPVLEQIPFDFAATGYDLILTDVKQSHADLSDEYSKMPYEMKDAAKVCGKEVLSEIGIQDLLDHAVEIRETCGDRAFLRAYHFVYETDRVIDEVNALKSGEFHKFLDHVNESGRSSYMYLQNVLIPGDSKNQAVGVALALSECVLNGTGAFRVHGGGFAGTIQAFVPEEKKDAYIRQMEAVFGKDCCYCLKIRKYGGVKVPF